MKKGFLLIISALITGIIAFAQSPNYFNYQTVVRDGSGALQTNANVTFEVSIISGVITNSPVYTETHSYTTNQFGIVNFSIGSGTPTLGTFSSIDWSTGDFFVNTKVDLGNGLQDMGTNQLLSVPFAMHANTVTNDNVDDADSDPTNEFQTLAFVDDSLEISDGNRIALPNGGKTYLILTGDITDAEASDKIASEVGTNTQVILIQNTTVLTTLSLPNISEVVSLKITNNEALTSVDFSGLTISFEDILVTDNPLLTSISFPVLEEVIPSINGILVSNNADLTNASFPSLKKTNLYLTQNPNLATTDFSSFEEANIVNITQNGLASINFPVLTFANELSVLNNDNLSTLGLPSIDEINYLNITSNSSLSAFEAPSITSIGRFSRINDNPMMTSIDLTNMVSLGLPFSIYDNNTLSSILIPNLTTAVSTGPTDFSVYNNPLLTSLTSPVSGNMTLNIKNNISMTSLDLPNVIISGYNCDLNNNLFPSSQINALLAQMAAQPAFSGMVINMYQSVAAPPTGQGLTDKNTLTTNGNTVLTD